MTLAENEPVGTLAEMQHRYIMETLQRTNWVIGGSAGAAAKLGLPRTTLIARMQKLGISRETSRPHVEQPAAWPDSQVTGKSVFAHAAGM